MTQEEVTIYADDCQRLTKEICEQLLEMPEITAEENEDGFRQWKSFSETDYYLKEKDFWEHTNYSDVNFEDHHYPNDFSEDKIICALFDLMRGAEDFRVYMLRTRDPEIKRIMAECEWSFLEDWRFMQYVAENEHYSKVQYLKDHVARYTPTLSAQQKLAIEKFIDIFKGGSMNWRENALAYANDWVLNEVPNIKAKKMGKEYVKRFRKKWENEQFVQRRFIEAMSVLGITVDAMAFQ